jgi:hypothetical protein
MKKQRKQFDERSPTEKATCLNHVVLTLGAITANKRHFTFVSIPGQTFSPKRNFQAEVLHLRIF